MKKIMFILVSGALICACSGGTNSSTNSTGASADNSATSASGNPSYDPKRGEGKFTKVDIDPTLNVAMADAGKKIYDVKCASCHKLTTEKLVGPGWSGVTKKLT